MRTGDKPLPPPPLGASRQGLAGCGHYLAVASAPPRSGTLQDNDKPSTSLVPRAGQACGCRRPAGPGRVSWARVALGVDTELHSDVAEHRPLASL